MGLSCNESFFKFIKAARGIPVTRCWEEACSSNQSVKNNSLPFTRSFLFQIVINTKAQSKECKVFAGNVKGTLSPLWAAVLPGSLWTQKECSAVTGYLNNKAAH